MRTLATTLSVLLLCISAPVKAADHATLTGKVVDEAGAPVSHATVLVYKAGVKVGYSTYCPTCYVDCGKHALTDADGTFELKGLSPDLLFTLLVIHEGNATAQANLKDPAKGPVDTITMKPRPAIEDLSRVVRGRVVDLQGNALQNAVIEQQGVIFPNGGQSYGPNGWTDQIAITNEKGEFEIAHTKPAAKFIISVTARGMAPKLFTQPTGADRPTLTVAEGATVRGRLVYQGKPVANAEVGLISHGRRSGTTYPETRIGMQENGTFVIANVPAGRIWTLYPKMESLTERNVAAQPLDLETRDNGQDVNVGDIELTPAHKLSGQVVLSDGKLIPEGMRIQISPDRAWDTQTALLPANGQFEFAGLASGVYTLNPAIKGYELLEGFDQEIMVNADRQITIRLYPKTR